MFMYALQISEYLLKIRTSAEGGCLTAILREGKQKRARERKVVCSGQSSSRGRALTAVRFLSVYLSHSHSANNF